MESGRSSRGKAAALGALTVGLLAVAAWGYLRGETPAQGSRYYWRSSAGAVVFDHAGHADYASDCGDCHHETRSGLDAASCRGCHPAATPEEPAFVGCASCHDDGEYAADSLEHDELLEIHDPDCSGCHAARGVADVLHRQCGDCHREQAPERFVTAEGQTACAACHLK